MSHDRFYPSDQFGYSTLLSESELDVLGQLWAVLDAEVQPLLADHWEADEFPFEIVPKLVDVDLVNRGISAFYGGFRNFELARTDASVATFYNPEFLFTLTELDLLFDRDDRGSFQHFYTETVGYMFLKVVQ
ncbi:MULTISPECIES: hypothetical protein [unclassified Cryobacterium]|uniref:hypothetical protein n=1 Tax=unclassified Cryobacterium TaxID=2649013 RepID=UPI000CE3A87D|nr:MULTISPECIES: hypothetical protein [unclassified Cryobacterium]